MLGLIVCLYMALGSTDVTYEGLEIFEVLPPARVVVAENGELFVADEEESQIKVFDTNGEQIRTIGQEGQGPGEFQRIGGISLVGESLFVMDYRDNGMIHEYALDGTLIKDHKLNSFQIHVGAGGWIFGEWRPAFGGRPADPGQLEFQPFKGERRQLLDMRPKGFTEDTDFVFSFKPGADGKIAFDYNPATDSPHFAVSADGKVAALTWSGLKGKISFYNMETGALLWEKALDGNALPFNTPWGEMMVKRKNDVPQTGRAFKLKYVPDFPESFPFVRDVTLPGDGLVYVEKWTANPERKREILAFDFKGKPAKPFYSAEALERVLAIHKGLVYVGTYDEDEGAGISVMKAEAVNQFVKDNPMAVEEGHLFSIRG